MRRFFDPELAQLAALAAKLDASMALVTVLADASMDGSTGQFAPQIPDGIAGEDILGPGTPCYIKAADGLIYMCNGTAADEKAVLAGFAARAAKAGQVVTLFGLGTRFRYGSALTAGAKLFLAATAGRLDTVATTGDAVGVAQVIPSQNAAVGASTDIRVTRAI